MKSIRVHGTIFFLLLVITFASFGHVMTTPLWNHTDIQILHEAKELSPNLFAMIKHIGFYFSQPLLELAFMAEYEAFGLQPAGYIAVNLFIHTLNSFFLYMLVNLLFPRNKMAVLAAALFAFGVGNYGKIFMTINQLESLLLASFHLLVLYFFIRNDFRRDGKVKSSYFAIGLGLFLMTGLTKTASFSLVGCLIAYKIFFFKHRQRRRIFSADILVFVCFSILFYLGQHKWGFKEVTVFDGEDGGHHFSLISIKNIFRYLNLMFFPLQNSPLLETSGWFVVLLYETKTIIRTLLTIAIASYSFFGFVFGSQATRFFIAWTYIMLIPFAGQSASGSWLNLNHLYLTSLGFCVILAAGTVGTSRLLIRRRWRRYVPYLIPLVFIMASLGLSHRLNNRHVVESQSAKTVAIKEILNRSK